MCTVQLQGLARRHLQSKIDLVNSSGQSVLFLLTSLLLKESQFVDKHICAPCSMLELKPHEWPKVLPLCRLYCLNETRNPTTNFRHD